MKTLLELLSLHGGEIVCSSSLDSDSINQAEASSRMYVNENNIGFIWVPPIHKFPTTDEEVEQFEKWFPLDVEMPEKFNDPSFLFKKSAALTPVEAVEQNKVSLGINLRQTFRNNTNCYADTWSQDGIGAPMVEGEVIPAMTEDKFIEVVTAILNTPTKP